MLQSSRLSQEVLSNTMMRTTSQDHTERFRGPSMFTGLALGEGRFHLCAITSSCLILLSTFRPIYICELHTFMCRMYEQKAVEVRGTLDLLNLKLQAVVSHRADAGN